MHNWLHQFWINAEKELESLRLKSRPLAWFVQFLLLAVPASIAVAISDKFIEGLEWRTIVKVIFYSIISLVLIILPLAVLMTFEIRAARAKKIQMSFTGWAFGLVVVLLFAFKQIQPHFALKTGLSVGGKQTEIVTNIQYQTITLNPTQWYLRITWVGVLYSGGANPLDPKDVRFRINPIVNGQRYSTPSQKIFAHTGDQWANESFPLPVGIGQYEIQFDGLTFRGMSNEPGTLQAQMPARFSIEHLPVTDQICDIQVPDNIDPNTRAATKIEIYYDIVTNIYQ